LSYIRFTLPEYRTILRLSRSIELLDEDLPIFSVLLVESLAKSWPDLARKVTRFRPSQLRLLFEHVRGRRGSTARCQFTAEERRALGRACASFPLPGRFKRHLRATLVRRFRQESPAIAEKLARLDARQFEGLYEEVRRSHPRPE
jgi:hypothetical protein